MKAASLILIFTFIFIGGPFYVWLQKEPSTSWLEAKRSSSEMAPLAAEHPEALLLVYSARAFNWRGVFAVHTWISIKPKNASSYTVIHVLGWRSFIHLPVLSIEEDIPDRFWFNQKPTLIKDIRNEEAEILIPQVMLAVENYTFKNRYIIWPGPNSNTFTAEIARAVPGLHLSLPSLALGKDFLPMGIFFAPAPSGTGYQFSFLGILGVLVAEDEGLELNILGLVFGLNLKTFALKIPGIGETTS